MYEDSPYLTKNSNSPLMQMPGNFLTLTSDLKTDFDYDFSAEGNFASGGHVTISNYLSWNLNFES